MKRFHLSILVCLLLVTVSGIFYYKAKVLQYPLLPISEVEVWTVEAKVDFTANADSSVKATLRLPDYTPNFSTLDESFISRGYGLTTQTVDDFRTAIWTQRRPAPEAQTLYYRTQVIRDNRPVSEQAFPGAAEPPELDPPLQSAAEALLADIRSRSADIDSFSTLLVQEVNRSEPSENVAAFLTRTATPLERTQLIIDLLAGARIPARMVHGFSLAERSQNMHAIPWLEYHNSREWVAINATTGEHGFPPDFLVWWTGNEASPLKLERAQEGRVNWSVSSSYLDAMTAATQAAEKKDMGGMLSFSLHGLPVDIQNTYRILLLLPLGTLLIVFLRNVIGLHTFGTFMPVLIALSFRKTQLLHGIALFSIVVALGLLLRFYLEHLKLLLVPRLAAVVTIVVMLMTLLAVLSHRLDIQAGLSLGLFPIVILAMTIERMSLVWEEHGAADAIQQGVGSLIVAAICYLLLINRYVEHVFFVFPELILGVLALLLLLGRYTGYRFSELFRFSALSGPSGDGR